MKILITSDWYSPAVNGVVTSVKNLRRELERRGHEVRVLTLSQSRRSWEKDGVTYLGSIAAGLVYPGARLRTALAGKRVRQLIDWHPDVVHSQCEFSTFFLARRIAEELDIPLVHTYHTVYEDYTHYFSPSVRFGKQAVAVFSGIDLAPFSREADPWRSAVLRASLDIPADRTILAFVGRLAEEKNIDELLRCRAALGDAPVTLLIVGDGPDRPRLEQTAAALSLAAPDVVFAGMVAPEQVADWYQLGDLFVSASTSETQGLTYIEALAAGVPALCRADPCLAGVIRNGENGWQYRDEAEFQARLSEFLAQPHHRERLASCARVSAEEFSAQRFAERVEAVYEEQIARRAGADVCREVSA